MKPKLLTLMKRTRKQSDLIRIIATNIKNYSNKEFKEFIREIKK